MSVKVYNIRLDKEHLQADQNRMNEFIDTVNVKLTSSNFVTTSSFDYWSVLIFYEPKKNDSTPIIEKQLSREQSETFQILKKWRRAKANELKIAPFMICNDVELLAVAFQSPKSIPELRKIKGFGEIRTAKFGKEIITLLNSI